MNLSTMWGKGSALVGIFLVGGFLAVVLVPIFRSAAVASSKSNCLSRLKDLSRHADLYTADHDYYVDAHRWTDLLKPSVESSATFTCLRSSGISYSYAMNEALSGKRQSTLASPETHLLFFDSKVMAPNAFGGENLFPSPPRHYGHNYGVYADGHVRPLPPSGGE